MNDGGRPNIFLYDQFRLFIKDMVAHIQKKRPELSYRYFSKQAGFGTPNYFQRVIEGKRKLSESAIFRFAKVLKLSPQERRFFRRLVHFNQCKNARERNLHLKELFRYKGYRTAHPILDAQVSYYTNWYYVAIRELMLLSDFEEDPEKIAKRLSPSISVSEVREALAQLQAIGLASRGPDGKLRASDRDLATPPEVTNMSVVRFHQQMIQMAAESIERFRGNVREVSSITVAIRPEDIPILKKKIQDFQRELVTMLNQNPVAPDRIAQLNFQLFPLSEPPKKAS